MCAGNLADDPLAAEKAGGRDETRHVPSYPGG
jgi:hypothetical protein